MHRIRSDIYIYDFEFLFKEKIMNKSKILFTIFYIEDELIDFLFHSFRLSITRNF